MTKRARLSAAVALAAGSLAAGALAVEHVAADDHAVSTLVEGAAALRTAERLTPVPAQPEEGRMMFPLAPSNCGVLTTFGWRGPGDYHEGIDIMNDPWSPVFAVEAGVLTQRYQNTGSAGYGWKLRTPDGVVYKFFHLQDDLGDWEVGDSVPRGAVIGYVGSSGNDSPDNNHLHFEYRPNNVAANPIPLLDIPDACAVW